MPGRNAPANYGYRYGFNGKENDKEFVSTSNGTQDYGFRIYNPSLGRFLSVDPLGKDYAYYTPYSFAGNKPIAAIDLDGLEDVFIVTLPDKTESMQIRYTEEQIVALIKGTTIPMKIYYNGKETSQFQGPNKQNEIKFFRDKIVELNSSLCNKKESDKNGDDTHFLKTPIFIIPKPEKPKTNIKHIGKGFLISPNIDSDIPGANAFDKISGPNGVLGTMYLKDIDNYIEQLKTDGISNMEINIEMGKTVEGIEYNDEIMQKAANTAANSLKTYIQKQLPSIKIKAKGSFDPNKKTTSVDVKTN